MRVQREIVRGDDVERHILFRDDQTISAIFVPLVDLTRIEGHWQDTRFTPGTDLYFKRWTDDQPGLYRVTAVEDMEEGWRRVDLAPLDGAHKSA